MNIRREGGTQCATRAVMCAAYLRESGEELAAVCEDARAEHALHGALQLLELVQVVLQDVVVGVHARRTKHVVDI